MFVNSDQVSLVHATFFVPEFSRILHVFCMYLHVICILLLESVAFHTGPDIVVLRLFVNLWYGA